jgi:hypothetical protein
MLDFGFIVEKRIQEALEKGEFDDLPGAGRPLELEYEPLVPPEVRMACRILKNAGIAPPEVVQRREMAELEALVAEMEHGEPRSRALQRLALLRTVLGTRRAAALRGRYASKILEKLSGLSG